MAGVKKRATDALARRWRSGSKVIDITRRGDQTYMAGLPGGTRYKVHAFAFLDDLMILLDGGK